MGEIDCGRFRHNLPKTHPSELIDASRRKVTVNWKDALTNDYNLK